MPRFLVIDHHDSSTWNPVHLVAEVTGSLPPVVEHDDADVGDAAVEWAESEWKVQRRRDVLGQGPAREGTALPGAG